MISAPLPEVSHLSCDKSCMRPRKELARAFPVKGALIMGKRTVDPSMLHLYLPPANEVWGKVIFSQAPIILFTGGGVCMPRGGCMPSGGMRAWACACRGHAWPGGTLGRRDGHCSGWQASYWNAFLLAC